MKKIILLDDYFPTGEQTMQPAVLWHNGKAYSDGFGGITKTAGEALDYIKNVKPEPGKTIVLVLALGDEETYGPNRNGDGFPSKPVKDKNGKIIISSEQTLDKAYKSFESAHAFMHHQNKDPAKAVGKVMKAFWNPKMRRVELLVSIDNMKDPEWVQKINDNELAPVSMGCRIKHDICSICHNVAPTRREYCDHAKFQLGQLMSDGRRVYVHNPSPNFFDISRVFRPADKTGYTLKKVAYEISSAPSSSELGEYIDQLENKRAAINKISDIDKIIRGETVGYKNDLTPAEGKILERYRDYKSKEASSSLWLDISSIKEISLPEALAQEKTGTLANIANLFLSKTANKEFNSDQLNKIALLQPLILKIYSEYPGLINTIEKTGIFTEKTGGVLSMAYRNVVPEGSMFRDYEPATTDTMHVTDAQGHTYTTTRGAARDAHDAMVRSQIKKQMGGAALLGGGYKLLRSAGGLSSGALPLGLVMGHAGLNMMRPDYAHQLLKTDENYVIPSMTESVKTSEVAEVLFKEYLNNFKKLAETTLKKSSISGEFKDYLTVILNNGIDSYNLTDKIGAAVNNDDRSEVEEMLNITHADFDKIASYLGNLIY